MMDAGLRAFVRERAHGRCEYCQLHENDADFLSFHVEHIIAKQHGGADDAETLCFACVEHQQTDAGHAPREPAF